MDKEFLTRDCKRMPYFMIVYSAFTVSILYSNTAVEHMRMLDREKDNFSDIDIPVQVLK